MPFCRKKTILDSPVAHIKAPCDCSGCGLCVNVCSKNAISLKINCEGFYAPVVDLNACVNCGLCVKTCPALAQHERFSVPEMDLVKSYAVWNKNGMVHEKSSSGGVFTALAQLIISQGGCVFGVVWSDTKSICFAKAENVEELQPMRGSKYLQAYTGYVYRDVQKELNKERKVIFFGSPCQVHALRKYVKKNKEYLYCVDLVCHGVPSHLLMDKYVQECETRNGRRLRRIDFREKWESWNRFNVCRIYDDDIIERECFMDDVYMRFFLSDKILNKVCYNCPFAQIPRQGDLTVGDYWGVEKYHADWPIRMGISTVLVNSEKGEELLRKADSMLEVHREPFSNIYKGQPVVYIRPLTMIPKDREKILNNISRQRKGLPQMLDELFNYKNVACFLIRRSSFLFICAQKIKRKLNSFWGGKKH